MTNRIQVLIVGAGPTGLMLAIELARRDIGFRLIDRNPAPLTWDRATVVKPRTLEIMETLGLAEAFLEKGQIVTCVDLFDHDKLAATIAFAHLDSPFPHMLSLPESDTEAILTHRLHELGGEVERSCELIDLSQDGDGVTATLHRPGDDEPGHREIVEADWVVGTDGLHSAVREAVGDAFEGHDNPRLWAVVDGHIENWARPAEHIAALLQMPSSNPIPLKDGRWRIYFRPASRDPSVLQEVEAGLRQMSPGASLGTHDEPRFFHTHSRVAHAYRMDRVLLAGDAAHACSPIQGHGLNTGIQDAHNLGWKLALVAGGRASAELLDSYQAERRPIGELIVRTSDEAEASAVRQDPEERRHLIAELADPVTNRKAAENESETTHLYIDSPIIAPDSASRGNPRPGRRVGDADGLELAGKPCRLFELLRTTRHVVVASGMSAEAHTAATEAAADLADVYGLAQDGTSDDGKLLVDRDDALAHRLGLGANSGMAIIRPDGILGLRHPVADPEVAGRYFRNLVVER